MPFSIFRRNTKAKAEEVNQNFELINGDRIIAFDTSTAQAKTTFDLGDLTAVTNGSLVGNILIREGSVIKIYNSSGAFLRNVSLDASTTSSIGQSLLSKPIIIANNSTDPDNDIDFSAGNFIFDDGSGQAYYAGGTGQLDVNFGTGNGMLDTGSKASDTWYYLYMIYSPSTGTAKPLATATYGSPTMPSGYTKKKYLAAVRVDGSSNIRTGKYIIMNNKNAYRFIYNVDITAFSGTSPIAGTDLNLEIPPNSLALLSGTMNHSGSASAYILKSKIDLADVYCGVIGNVANSRSSITPPFPIQADSSSDIQHGYDASLGSASISLFLHGWIEYN